MNLEQFWEVVQERQEEDKARTLRALNLYERVYSPDGKTSEEFPNTKYDKETGTYRAYKTVPIEVNDRQYQVLKEYARREGLLRSTNPTAYALFIVAMVIYAIGAFLGVLAIDSLGEMIAYWFVAAVSGTLFLGLSEIINLLDDIRNK